MKDTYFYLRIYLFNYNFLQSDIAMLFTFLTYLFSLLSLNLYNGEINIYFLLISIILEIFMALVSHIYLKIANLLRKLFLIFYYSPDCG
jgi:hypothetical protein